MKPNFALSLSFDGLRLMHRVEGGWHLVGQVALDTPDLAGELRRLRNAAADLDPMPVATKLLIPNDQIRYLALDTTRTEEHDVVAALEGATPYPVSELVYDYAKGGGRTYVAAVARETLDEASAFASEHGFNPISFAAVPEPFTYVGEAFFGAADGHTAERDADAVVVIGQAAVTLAEPASAGADVETSENALSETTSQDAADTVAAVEETPSDAITNALPEIDDDAVEDIPTEDVEFTPFSVPQVAQEEYLEEDFSDLNTGAVSDPEPQAAEPKETETAQDDSAHEDVDADETVSQEAESPVDLEVEQAAEEDAAPPVFASLRADRDEGRPAPVAEEPDEPVFGRRAPPALAVPTGQGTDPMPPVVAPSRDDTGTAPAPVTAPTAEDATEPDVAPAITGEAATALPPEAAASAASLTAEPDVAPETSTPDSGEKSAGAAALGAATAVTSAVGGMFASRRMARSEAKAKAAEEPVQPQDNPDEKSKFTVFGARKKPKPKAVVGGKPRFLGLILTAVLLLFLLAIAAFAALADDTIARWLGFDRGEETQVAATETEPAEVAEPIEVAVVPDALSAPTAPTGAQILTPEEADRIYAATGVWQRAPRIPQTPRTTSLDGLELASAVAPVTRVPASPLADASSVAGDAVIATPVDPPPPSATFNFGTDGLVVASPEGAPTPDGVLIIAGAPPLNPPTRPGTVAPEVTPQDQLAAVIPEQATPITDAPAGVIVISGSPSITPPVRTGTVAPAQTLTDLATGDAPLIATDRLVVLAGTPPVLPPIRPGTTAPASTAVTPSVETPTTEIATISDGTNDGLNVIAGAPPILPPIRPGTTAPTAAAANPDVDLDALSADIATALGTTTAQTPNTTTARPLVRPESVTLAAAALANTPVLGALTSAQAAAFRPQTRPAGLAPAPVEEPAPVEVTSERPAVPTAPEGLQIAPEIAAAVQAAENRPNPIVNPTAQAVALSERPDTRPRNMERIVARAQAAQERAATQVAAVAPRTVAPSGPTGGSVAQNATLENAINLRNVNLIGIYGGSGDRRALVRLGNGRFLRLTVGDRLDGGRVTAISADALSYTKSGRAITLEVPG